MSKADEMFEKLGYEKYEDNYNIKYFKGNHEIWFYKKRKEIESCCGIGSEYIDMQELKAINEKCKELGWIEDKSKQSNLKVIIDGIDTDKIIEETRKEMKEE